MTGIEDGKINAPGKTIENQFEVGQGIMNLVHVPLHHDVRQAAC